MKNYAKKVRKTKNAPRRIQKPFRPRQLGPLVLGTLFGLSSESFKKKDHSESVMGHLPLLNFLRLSRIRSSTLLVPIVPSVSKHTQNTLDFALETQGLNTLISSENTQKHTETHLNYPPPHYGETSLKS